MATKHNCTCLEKAADEEPIFVLRAQDASAAKVIRYWAYLNSDTLQAEKYVEAIKCAEEFENWPNQKQAD